MRLVVKFGNGMDIDGKSLISRTTQGGKGNDLASKRYKASLWELDIFKETPI